MVRYIYIKTQLGILLYLLYSLYTQTGKDFFLAEIIDEAVGWFDDSMWANAAVAYHKYDQTEYSHEEEQTINFLHRFHERLCLDHSIEFACLRMSAGLDNRINVLKREPVKENEWEWQPCVCREHHDRYHYISCGSGYDRQVQRLFGNVIVYAEIEVCHVNMIPMTTPMMDIQFRVMTLAWSYPRTPSIR